MSIAFDQIPADSLIPFFYVEFNNSAAAAGSALVPWIVLIIGQKTAAGTAPALSLVEISANGQANGLFGAGSMLARQVEAYRSKPGRVRMFAFPLEDAATAAAAVKHVTYNGTAAAAGSAVVYVGGRRAEVGVALADVPADFLPDLATAVNAIPNCAMIATVSGSALVLTARNKGAQGSQIDVRTTYAGEALPTGLTAVVSSPTAGSVDPDLTALGVVGILGSQWFQAICNPYQDATNMGYIDAALVNRWSPQRQIGGIQYTGKAADFSTVQAWAAGKNSPFTAPVNASDLPTPPEEFVAEYVAEIAQAANIDPARPFQTLGLLNAKPPILADRLMDEENDLLLKAGCSTFVVDQGGTVRIQRVITSYKTSPAGEPDKSYRNPETIYTLQAIGYDFKVYMKNKYPRHKLASDGANFGEGQPIMTPKLGKSEAVARAIEWEKKGWIEDLKGFKKALIVERNEADRDRLDFLLEPNTVNQFRIAGVQIRFIL